MMGSLEEPVFLTRAEVARMLRLSEITVHRLTSRGLLPFYRLSRRLRFLRADILTFAKRHRVPARDPHHYGDPQDQG